MKRLPLTHEVFINRVREEVLATAKLSEDEQEKIRLTKLVYGAGRHGVRGVCYFGTWKGPKGKADLVEICAMGQENWVQLMGTTVHELAHVIAGPMAGHSKEWKETCERLGFRIQPEAAGQKYTLAMFPIRLREFGASLAKEIADGAPEFLGAAWLSTIVGTTSRPCGAGVGTRGGKGRSGRRSLWQCQCERPTKVYTSGELKATCDECGEGFARVSA